MFIKVNNETVLLNVDEVAFIESVYTPVDDHYVLRFKFKNVDMKDLYDEYYAKEEDRDARFKELEDLLCGKE